jgi:hypothetical protein
MKLATSRLVVIYICVSRVVVGDTLASCGNWGWTFGVGVYMFKL